MTSLPEASNEDWDFEQIRFFKRVVDDLDEQVAWIRVHKVTALHKTTTYLTIEMADRMHDLRRRIDDARLLMTSAKEWQTYSQYLHMTHDAALKIDDELEEMLDNTKLAIAYLKEHAQTIKQYQDTRRTWRLETIFDDTERVAAERTWTAEQKEEMRRHLVLILDEIVGGWQRKNEMITRVDRHAHSATS